MKIRNMILGMLLILLSSCDPSSEYVYVISNESSETAVIDVYSEWGESRWPIDAYIITNGNVEDNRITLPPSSTVSLSYHVPLSAAIQVDPAAEGVPLWSERSPIEQIRIGEVIIPETDWRERGNWPRRNKKQRYAEYWYTIK